MCTLMNYIAQGFAWILIAGFFWTFIVYPTYYFFKHK